MPNQTIAQIKLGSGIGKAGKTAREHANGKHARRLSNKAARAAWNRTVGPQKQGKSDFPTEVCNGRDTRALRAAEKRGGKETRKARERNAGKRQTDGNAAYAIKEE